jgi:thiol-disulfide isomerase/thioredoxin
MRFHLDAIIVTLFLFFGYCVKAKDSITVYVFLLDECKICQDVAPELRDLAKKYNGKIGFLGVFPNFSSKFDGIQKFVDKYKIPFSTKTDHSKSLSRRFEATILPEVIVYNETQKSIVYRGLINDRYLIPSKRRSFIKNHYLGTVLQEIDQKIPISINFTKAVGCFINFQD